MKIRIGYDIGYGADVPTPMVIMLNVHPSRQGDLVGIEQISTAPYTPITYYRDGFGNICGRLVAPAGGVVLSCRGDGVAIPVCRMWWCRRRSKCRSSNCRTNASSI